MRDPGTFLFTLVLSMVAAVALAQGPDRGGWGGDRGGRGGRGGDHGDRGGPGGDRGGPRGGPDDNRPLSAEEIAQRQSRAAEFLRRLDANGNGIIEDAEVKGPERFFIERMFTRLGTEPKFPLSINEAQQKVGDYYRARSSGATPGGSSPSATPDSKASPSSGTTPPQLPGFGNPATPQAPAFGGWKSPSPVPGFGEPGKPASGAPGSPGSGGPPGWGRPSFDNPDDQKIRALAAAIIQQNDKDSDGKLDSAEWPKQGKWGTFDEANRQSGNYVTLDELIAHLRDYLRRGVLSSADLGGPGTSPLALARKSNRFLSPKERLPKGLPDWFLDKDRDGDGQVSMAEYAFDWSNEKAAEFNRYDLNRDGVVTASECLKAEKRK